MRTGSLLLVFILVASSAPSAGSEGFAEVVANLVSFDPVTQTASYRVDTLYQYSGDELTRHDGGLRVTCNILGQRPWSTALQNGETVLSFPLVRSNGPWLEVPAEGWRVSCRCNGQTTVKEVAMFGMFVTPQGLSSRIKGQRGSRFVRIVSLGSGGKDRLPQTIRIRLGWTRGLLDAATSREPAEGGSGHGRLESCTTRDLLAGTAAPARAPAVEPGRATPRPRKRASSLATAEVHT